MKERLNECEMRVPAASSAFYTIVSIGSGCSSSSGALTYSSSAISAVVGDVVGGCRMRSSLLELEARATGEFERWKVCQAGRCRVGA